MDRISEVLHAARVVLGKEGIAFVDSAEWGYDCGELSSDELNRLNELTRALKNYKRALQVEGVPCLCDHEAQALVEKILDITGVQYCVSIERTDYTLDSSGVASFIMMNPLCVTTEEWTDNLIRLCPAFTPVVQSVIDEKQELSAMAQLLEIMVMAEPDKCATVYELIVAQASPELCDLTYRVVVKQEEDACKLAGVISVIAKTCVVDPRIEISLETCIENIEILASKLECNELPAPYVEAINCGLSPDMIVDIISCGGDVKIVDGVPVVTAFGKEITVTESCTSLDIIVSKQ